MKIRNRITYTFTALFGGLIFAICVIVYVVTERSREALFYNQLDERLKITEVFFLESDAFDENMREKVRANFLKTLPSEIEFLDSLQNFSTPDSLHAKLPNDFVTQLKANGSLQWSDDKEQGIARIYVVNEIEYVVFVIAEDEYGHAYLGKLKFILVISFLTAVILTYFLSYYFSKKVLKPIAGKINKANKISATNLDLRLTVHNPNDELGMLALSFNGLLDRLQTAFEVEKNFVRYASHEIKNPLAVILGEAEVALLKTRTANEYLTTIEKIKKRAEKLNSLVDHFLQLSKLESGQMHAQKMPLDELLMEILFDLSQHYNDIQTTFSMSEEGDSDDFVIDADRQLMYTALYNLVENACKFSAPGSEVIIDLSHHVADHKITLLIRDQGMGIEEAHMPHIFKPLYRGANAHHVEGTGIGLALVKRILDLHGGTIEVFSEVGQGTEFKVQF